MADRHVFSRHARIAPGPNLVPENHQNASLKARALNSERETTRLQAQRQSIEQRYENLLRNAANCHVEDIAEVKVQEGHKLAKSYRDIQVLEERVAELEETNDQTRTELEELYLFSDRNNALHRETQKRANDALEETRNELERSNALHRETQKRTNDALEETRNELKESRNELERSNARQQEAQKESNDKFAYLEEMMKAVMQKQNVEVGTLTMPKQTVDVGTGYEPFDVTATGRR